MQYIDFRQNSQEAATVLVDKVYDHLRLPESTFLGARITKKMLIESNELVSSEKKLVTEFIDSIVWRNTLKPDTVNIATYVTDKVEYLEVAVLQVILKEREGSRSQLKNITKLLHTLIPYPLILFIQLGSELALSLADKRINQADKTKLVVEHIYSSDWLGMDKLSDYENSFLNDFSLANVSSLNYFELYQDFISMLISLQASRVSGVYTPISGSVVDHNKEVSEDIIDNQQSISSSDSSFFEKSNEEKTAALLKLDSLEAELASIRNKLKKETQMSEKIKLNVDARKIKKDIAAIKAELT